MNNLTLMILVAFIAYCNGSGFNQGINGASQLGYGYPGYYSGQPYNQGCQCASGLGYPRYDNYIKPPVATPGVSSSVLPATSSGCGYGGCGYNNGVGYGSPAGHIGYHGPGVIVQGPSPIPAIISGPSGKIVTNGYQDVSNHENTW